MNMRFLHAYNEEKDNLEHLLRLKREYTDNFKESKISKNIVLKITYKKLLNKIKQEIKEGKKTIKRLEKLLNK